MATSTVARSAHSVLSAGVVDTVVFGAKYPVVTFLNRGLVAVYLTTDGSTPVVGGSDTLVVPPMTAAELPVLAPLTGTAPSTTTVKMTASSGVPYSVTITTMKLLNSSGTSGGGGGGGGTAVPLPHADTHSIGDTDVLTPEALGAVSLDLLGDPNGVATLDASGNNAQPPATHSHQAYVAVRDNGTSLTQRSRLNVIGGTLVDDGINDQTTLTIPTPVAGTSYTPIDLVLSGDQSKTSNASFTNITGFSFSIEANAIYLLDGTIPYNAGATGDLDLRLSGPSGCTAVGSFVANNGAAANDAAGTKRALQYGAVGVSLGPFGGFGAANGVVDFQRVRIVNGPSAGTVTLDFAQDVPDATATIIKAGANATALRVA